MGGRRGGRGKEHYTTILINRSEDADNESEHLESRVWINSRPRKPEHTQTQLFIFFCICILQQDRGGLKGQRGWMVPWHGRRGGT